MGIFEAKSNKETYLTDESGNDVTLNGNHNILKNFEIEKVNLGTRDKNIKDILYYDYGKYEGSIINGKRDGYGILYYNNGNRYEGYWKNDKKDGRGIFHYNDGKKEIQNYVNDFRRYKILK